MDAKRKHIRMHAFTDVNVYVWTGPKFSTTHIFILLSLYYEFTTSVKTNPGVHKAIVCHIGFKAPFAALFVLNSCLRQFALSATEIHF